MDDLGIVTTPADLRVTGQSSDLDLRVVVYDDDLRVTVEGTIGINGKDGVGIPVGGIEGQVLTKGSSVDYDSVWVDPETGIPPNGLTHQVLTKKSDTSLDVEWQDVHSGVPVGGTIGQLLTKVSGSDYAMEWATPPYSDFISRDGGTMLGPLILYGDPTDPLEAVTKTYADTKVAATDVGTAAFENIGTGSGDVPTIADGDARWAPIGAGEITDPELLAIAGAASAADTFFYYTGIGTGTLTPITPKGRSLLDDPDAMTMRGTLELGTAAVKNIGTSGDAVPLLNTANTFSLAQTISVAGVTALTLVSTDESASAGPTLIAERISASPANGDALAAFQARGRSSTGVQRIFGTLGITAQSVSNGLEDAYFRMTMLRAGVTVEEMRVGGGVIIPATVTGGSKGTGTLNATTIYENNVSLSAKYQGIDPTLTGLSILDATPGIVEQTGVDTFTKRAIGVASGSSIPTRNDGDARWATLASPIFTGVPSAPTAAPGTNTAQLATTAFMQAEFTVQLTNYLNKTGGTMTGAITLSAAPTLDLHAATKQYVDDQIDGAYALEFDTIERTNLSRWNDNLNVTEIAPVDVTGSAATFHTALLGAFAKAVARNRRSSIHVPAGRLVCGAPLNLLNSFASSTQYIEIIGEGKTATLIVGPSSGGHLHVFGIGQNGVAQSGNIKIRDLTIAPAGVVEHAFLMHNARHCDVINVHNHLCKNFLRTGTAVGTLINSINYIKFWNCSGNAPAGGNMFHPETIQCLEVNGGDYTGGPGRKFFYHNSTAFNCDGIYLRPGYTEQFEYAIDSIGDGIVNAELTGGQWDRAVSLIRAQPQFGPGSNRNWTVHNTQLLDASDDGIIWDAGSDPLSKAEGINISGVNFHRLRKRILYCPRGSGIINAITARTCGYTQTELIRLGAEGNFEIGIVQAHMGGHDVGGFHPISLEPYQYPTWGIVYDGPSTGKRGHTAMRAWDATLGTYTGTP